MNFRYVEYGKIFLNTSRGALEYCPLNRSDNEIVANTKNFYLHEVATFGTKTETSSLDRTNNKVTFAFMPWDEAHYIFMQLQQRKEDEFVDKDKFASGTQRSFNQSRFTFINKKDIDPRSFGLATTLIFENPKYPGKKKLLDYIYPHQGEVKEVVIEKKHVTQQESYPEDQLLAGAIDLLFNTSSPGVVTKGKLQHRTSKPVFIKTKINLEEKIRFFDKLQYWLYPALGIITFASEYITNREVNITLSDNYSKRVDKERSYSENELSSNKFGSYFSAVRKLFEEELYHKTFEHYIRTDLDPEQVVKIFRLIEKESDFTIQEELEIIENCISQIRDEDLTKIVQKQFNKHEKLNELTGLLSKAPTIKRKVLLREILSETQKKLAKYYVFHLAALTGLSKDSQDTNDIRELLYDAIIHSSSESLDLVQENDRNVLYQELILTDFTLKKGENTSEYSSNLHFSDGKNIKLVLHTLMERNESPFFDTIQTFFSTSIGINLLNQIKKGLYEIHPKWGMGEIYKLWEIVPKKTVDLFLYLLIYILKNEEQHADLVSNTLLLKSFLIEGRSILYETKSKVDLSKDIANKPSLLEMLSSLENTEVALLLRKICIKVSYPSSSNNILFGHWWFLEELVKTEDNAFSNDYAELIKCYQPKFLPVNLEIPGEILYVLSGGKSNQTSSVEEYLSVYTNQLVEGHQDTYYTKILSFWANKQLILSKADITNLVCKLPDNISGNILKQIVLNNNKTQINEIIKITAKDAIIWLEHTKQLRITNTAHEDLLFNSLLNIKNPNVDFVRYMLAYDLTIAQTVNTWKDYWFIINEIYIKKWKRKVSDMYTETYIHILSSLNGPYNVKKYHVLLNLITSKLSKENISKEFEMVQKSVDLLTVLGFINENQNLDSRIKQVINSVISETYSVAEYQSVVKTLETADLQLLYLYNHSQNGKIRLEFQDFVEAEYNKRINYNKTLAKDLTSSNHTVGIEQPTQLRKVSDHIEKKVISTQKNVSNDQPKFSFLELILLVILALVIFTIIILTIIALSEPVFNELWKFFNFIRKQ